MIIGDMDKIDRISELPEFILHIILSILDTKSTIRASVLSKKWYRACSSIPVLDFNIKYFNKGSDIDSNYSDDDDDDDDIYDYRTVERFIGFVEKTMQRYFTRKYRITKLDIVLPHVDENIDTFVDNWISIAVQNQIQELNIDIFDYELPEILFRAKSLKVLTCNNVNLRYYETMDLVSLASLSFFLGRLDEDMLQKIISLSPLVELCITHRDIRNLSLPWTECVSNGTMRYNLKTAPLKEFVYHGLGSTSRWAWKMNLNALKNLRKLKIVATTVTDDTVSEIAYGLVALESLELKACSMLKCVKISSISLKKFVIEGEISFDSHNLVEITVDTPNLLEFWCSCDLEASVSLIRARDHCNTCFLPQWANSITIAWFAKLKKFLVETHCFKSLDIDLGCFSWMDIDEEVLRIIGITGSPYKLRELKLYETNADLFIFKQSTIMDYLDALFSTCNPDVLSLCFQNLPPEDFLGYLKCKVQCSKHPLKKFEAEGVDCSNLPLEPPGLEFRFRLSWLSVES
ncbi:uncharacterized protein LOC141637556 [Silene latifolia]|uniref:uncharacterized protein LOC141637556 n=1 Tax=Silene latifolia TaxID=37657 RepID=UPI003D76BCEA